MADWQQLLREHHAEPLGADEVDAIRQLALAAVAETAASARYQRRSAGVVIGGMLATAAAAGILVARSQPVAVPQSPVVSPAVVRQLQFATPGGTRIIWHFDPEFSMRGTLP